MVRGREEIGDPKPAMPTQDHAGADGDDCRLPARPGLLFWIWLRSGIEASRGGVSREGVGT
jgi:hypothetical protein